MIRRKGGQNPPDSSWDLPKTEAQTPKIELKKREQKQSLLSDFSNSDNFQ